MAKTTKPKPPPRTIKIGLLKTERIALPENSANLTPAEMRLIRAYRKLNDDVQSFMVACAERHATNPKLLRRSPTPALRLVTGGAA
jgi:hypothetical protein